MVNLEGYEELKDTYKQEEICDALSSMVRIEILKVMRDNPKITVGDLIRELEKRGLKMSHSGIRMHIPKLVFAGIVELTKINGRDALILKKDVRVFVKEVEKDE